jgi:hypothetical protein
VAAAVGKLMHRHLYSLWLLLCCYQYDLVLVIFLEVGNLRCIDYILLRFSAFFIVRFPSFFFTSGFIISLFF